MAAIWTLFDILGHISGLENGGKFIFVSISMFYGSMIPIKAILEVFTNVYTSNLHIICINYLKIAAILGLSDILWHISWTVKGGTFILVSISMFYESMNVVNTI